MRERYFFACALSVALATAAACGSSPAAPDAGIITGAGAGPDGATLKVTAPTPASPTHGVRLDGLRTTLTVTPSEAVFTAAPPLSYRFEVLDPAGETADSGISSTTRYEIAADLAIDTKYRWRARAEFQGHYGPWSVFREFRTIDYRGIVPRPRNGRWPSTGQGIVAYIAASFPERLQPTSLEQRVENMKFLRDRVIEAGICGGLDLAHNKKRGTGPHSIDALAWKKRPDFVEVIDIASAYDEASQTLRLHWIEVLGPPGYDGYPDHPGC